MRRNIDLTHGLVMSEAVMMGLGPYIGREYAHDLVYDICREAVKQQRPLLDLLAEHPEINKHLDRAALATLCDPANYLGQSGVMVDRVLDRLHSDDRLDAPGLSPACSCAAVPLGAPSSSESGCPTTMSRATRR